MKKQTVTESLVGAYGAGVLSMYFLDPQRGKRRRAEFRDALTHSQCELEKFAGRLGRDFENRVEGAIAETINPHRDQWSTQFESSRKAFLHAGTRRAVVRESPLANRVTS